MKFLLNDWVQYSSDIIFFRLWWLTLFLTICRSCSATRSRPSTSPSCWQRPFAGSTTRSPCRTSSEMSPSKIEQVCTRLKKKNKSNDDVSPLQKCYPWRLKKMKKIKIKCLYLYTFSSEMEPCENWRKINQNQVFQ